jgi:hypothetical protein
LALVRTDVAEKRISSIIRVTKIRELGTKLAATSNSRTLQPTSVPPKRRFLEEPHSVIFQKTVFFIVTTVKTPNLTQYYTVLIEFY